MFVVSRLEPYKKFTCSGCDQQQIEPASVLSLRCSKCGKGMQSGGYEWMPTQDVGRFKTREHAEQAIKSFAMFQHFRFEVREIESKSKPEATTGNERLAGETKNESN